MKWLKYSINIIDQAIDWVIDQFIDHLWDWSIDFLGCCLIDHFDWLTDQSFSCLIYNYWWIAHLIGWLISRSTDWYISVNNWLLYHLLAGCPLPPPTFAHAHVTSKPVLNTKGSYVEYACNLGYESDDPPTRLLCDKDPKTLGYKWSGNFTCESEYWFMHSDTIKVPWNWVNTHLITGLKGNSEFCFPETFDVKSTRWIMLLYLPTKI